MVGWIKLYRTHTLTTTTMTLPRALKRITRGHVNLDEKTDEIFITNALIEEVSQDRLGRVYIRVKAYER